MRGASCGKRPRSSSPGLGRGSLGEDIGRDALCRRRGSNGVGKHANRGLLKITPVCAEIARLRVRGDRNRLGVRRSGPGPSKRWNEGVVAQLCLRDEFEIDETASFFFLFETKRGQDGIGWSHISRDLGIGEIATQGRPKQSGEKRATVSVSSSSSGVCYLLLFLQTCVAMSCWGRNNYAKRRTRGQTVQTLPQIGPHFSK